jgi:FkbM family methyltransferase
MPVSYAQNFEDVMLWRALGHIESGRYIDIGAQHPIVDSVSLMFYEHGWRGIHVEPTPPYAELLRQARPEEVVIQAAIVAKSGILRFYEFPDTGLSTGDRKIAEKHIDSGFAVREIVVPGMTLDEVLSRESGEEVHWLKIDVEGGEKQVLKGWIHSALRPWVVLIESTLPLSKVESHKQWESLVLRKGYKFAYFDGLNRFYIADGHAELFKAFTSGPNVFDGVTLSGTASSSLCVTLNSRIRSLEDQRERERQEAEKLLTQRQGELSQQLDRNREETTGLAERLNAGKIREQGLARDIRERQAEVVRLEQARDNLKLQLNEQLLRQGELSQQLDRNREETTGLAERLNAGKIREQGLARDIRERQVEVVRLEQARDNLKLQLDEQLRIERETNHRLQQTLGSLGDELAIMRNALSWRFTAPFRTVAGWFHPAHGRPNNFSEHAIERVRGIHLPGLRRNVWLQKLIRVPLLVFSMATNQPARAGPNPETGEATSLRALLACQDHRFVQCAYLTLLKRQPDTDGFGFYLSRLRNGAPKLQLLGEIMESHEAQSIGIVVPGLRNAVKLHKALSRFPMFGFLFKTLIKKSSLLSGRAVFDPQSAIETRETLTQSDRQGQPEPTQASIASQGAQDGKDAGAGEIEGGLRLLSDRSVDEVAWRTYLGRVLNLRLTNPLRNAGTPPPVSALVVLVDCTDGVGSTEEQAGTSACLIALMAASEYPVRALWYFDNDAPGQIPEGEDGACNAFHAIAKRDIGRSVCDGDLVLVLKPGDEVRPELHMALMFFGSFDARFTLIDLYVRDNGRIFPFLLHAVDPIHASHSDYFLGRYVANGKIFKDYLDQLSGATLSAVGSAICSQLKIDDPGSYRHIAIPLLRVNTSNAALEEIRKTMILERTLQARAPNPGDSEPELKAGNRSATTGHASCVSAIICTKDCGLLLRQLLHRLESEALIRDILIVSNNTTNAHAIRTLVAASAMERVTVLRYDGSFNFSRQCNIGAKYAKGSELLFLNDDIAPVSDDWLPRLHGWMDSRRLVGPLLIYPNESVQHAGMHLGFNGAAGHVMRHSRLPSGDYGFFLTAPRRVSCLTGAALLMPKALFMSLNGFDPMLATYLQDVDLSLRALYSGCELVFDPRSILMHMESVSVMPTLENRKVQQSRELEYAYFANRWASTITNDAWMNPLFDPMDESLTALRA